jgi:GNAT superfamily N-acetyltransferase
MAIIQTTQLSHEQKETIFKLWNGEYPEKLGFKVIAELDDYLNSLPDASYYFLYNDKKEIIGWAITFARDSDKWFAIIIDSKTQGRGNGTLLINKLKQNTEILNGWVIDHENDIKQNGKPYRSPLQFYQKNGFGVITGSRLETPALSAVKISWQAR